MAIKLVGRSSVWFVAALTQQHYGYDVQWLRRRLMQSPTGLGRVKDFQ